jgi:uncharacterized protein
MTIGTTRKQVVQAYIEGFRRTDHDMILSCLADDISWLIHGYRTLDGKDAFDAEIENDAATGSPTLHLQQLIEESDTVVAIGQGQMTLKVGGPVDFVFAEAFTFRDDKISRIETFHINLSANDVFNAPDA